MGTWDDITPDMVVAFCRSAAAEQDPNISLSEHDLLLARHFVENVEAPYSLEAELAGDARDDKSDLDQVDFQSAHAEKEPAKPPIRGSERASALRKALASVVIAKTTISDDLATLPNGERQKRLEAVTLYSGCRDQMDEWLEFLMDEAVRLKHLAQLLRREFDRLAIDTRTGLENKLASAQRLISVAEQARSQAITEPVSVLERIDDLRAAWMNAREEVPPQLAGVAVEAGRVMGIDVSSLEDPLDALQVFSERVKQSIAKVNRELDKRLTRFHRTMTNLRYVNRGRETVLITLGLLWALGDFSVGGVLSAGGPLLVITFSFVFGVLIDKVVEPSLRRLSTRVTLQYLAYIGRQLANLDMEIILLDIHLRNASMDLPYKYRRNLSNRVEPDITGKHESQKG